MPATQSHTEALAHKHTAMRHADAHADARTAHAPRRDARVHMHALPARVGSPHLLLIRPFCCAHVLAA